MVAASRRPRLRPCAPIGGMTCAASPASAMRLRREAFARFRWRAGTGRGRPRPSTLPRIECAAPLDLGRQRGGIERGEPLGLGGIDDADEAGAQAGQWHQRERAALGVELGRDAVVRPCVAEIERQRGLRIVVPRRWRCRRRRGRATCGHRRRSARRAVSVAPSSSRIGDAVLARFHGRDRRLDAPERAAARRRGGRAPRSDAGSRYCGRTPRARSRRPRTAPPARGGAAAVSSISRIAVSGAACARQSGQTSSASSAATEPERSAVVRLSAGGAFEMRAVSTPAPRARWQR